MDSTPGKLGIVPGLRWMLASSRWSPWAPALIMLVIPELIAIGLEGRVANPFKQYLGVFPGDLFLSFAIGSAFWLAIYHMAPSGRQRWYASWQWQVWCVVSGLMFAGSVFYGELSNTLYRHVPDAAYTQAQFVSPTNLFHYVIVAVMSYILWAVVLPALIHSPRRFWWLKALIVLALLGWAVCAIVLDNSLPRPNLDDVHGEWFGGWYRD
jgi:hypothetical protein